MTEKKVPVNGKRKLVSTYQKMFNSHDGKIVLRDLMLVNFIHDSTFHPGDPQFTAFREGQRNAILRILTILKIDPDKFLETIEREASHVI